jgi:tyrosyl-tRNA synthetase
MGASDQWGNVLDGIDLIRRLRGKSTFGLTTPLITKADGTKFGKTESGTVWLDSELTRPFQFFQFWLNGEDANVLKYLDYFTFLSKDERNDLATQHHAAPQQRIAHRALAEEITRLVHGDGALQSALKATAVLFEGGDLRSLSEGELKDAFQETPRTVFAKELLGTPDAGLPSLVALSGLEPSKGRARKAIESGALSVNGISVAASDYVLTIENVLPGGYVVLRRGKKTYHILEVK